MKRLYPFFGVILALLTSGFTAVASTRSSVRVVEAGSETVVQVRTTLDHSTILEFPSKPISAVLGDHDSFKLEYVGNSITLKPLAPRAKSNLFVFTEYERFNCQIVTVAADQVDYIVRVRRKADPGRAITAEGSPGLKLKTTAIRKSATYDGFKVTLLSLSREQNFSAPRAVTLIDFELSSRLRSYVFQPGSVGIKQAGRFIDAESIYLDRLEIGPGSGPARGKVALLGRDYEPRLPLSLVFAVPDSTGKGAYRIEVPTFRKEPAKHERK